MPEHVLPHFARHGAFTPTPGGRLTVTLPNETTSAEVLSVHGPDVAIVRLKGPLLNQVGHQYKPQEIVTVQRQQQDYLRTEVWVPVDERKLHEMERAEALAEELARNPAAVEPDATTDPAASTPIFAPVEDGASAGSPPQDKPTPWFKRKPG